MLLWLAHRAWNLFYDPRGDCLEQRGAFLSCDFGLPRTRSSSAVHFGSLDSLHSFSGISSSSVWALGLILNGPESPDPLAPQQPLKILLSGSSDGEEDFDVPGLTSWPVESCFPMGARVSSSTHDTLLALRRTRRIFMNALFLGITQIASVFGGCIQWRLYEAVRIWKWKVPLGIGRNLSCLTFLL